jgi:hypothetical protein
VGTRWRLFSAVEHVRVIFIREVIVFLFLFAVVQVFLLIVHLVAPHGLFTGSLVALDHEGDLFGELEEVDAVLWVTVDNFLALNVVQVIFEDIFRQEVDQSLNVLRHFLVGFCLLELREVDVGKGSLKEANVKLVSEEDLHVVDRLFNAQVAKHLVSQLQNCLNNYKIRGTLVKQ